MPSGRCGFPNPALSIGDQESSPFDFSDAFLVRAATARALPLGLNKSAAEEEKSGPEEEAPPEPLFDLRQIVQLIHFSNLIHGFHAFWI